jgi:mono/diheme cytochrome c family protein
MLVTNRILWAAALFLVVLAHAALTAQTPAKTVWDGAYTDAQAERAQGTFSANCARCHTLTLEGARPLVGPQFWQANTQKTVGDLLKFVSVNMPNGVTAGSLSPSAYNDLVALILKSNGFPAGTFEVGPDAVANILIIPKDGRRRHESARRQDGNPQVRVVAPRRQRRQARVGEWDPDRGRRRRGDQRIAGLEGRRHLPVAT